MVDSSDISSVPSIEGDCLEIKELAEVLGAVDLEVQQAYEPHGKGTSLGSTSARCYKLGPCFNSPLSVQEDSKSVNLKLSRYYPSKDSKILVQNFSSFGSWNNCCKIGWHMPDETYCIWVEKLEKRLGQKWRDLRIYEAIMLSARLISFDSPLMSALMCFWDKSCNAFLLPEGPMGITMEDVVAITSCSPVGIELSTLRANHVDSKNFYQGPRVTGYSTFVSKAMALEDIEQEEKAFYLYWICKFLVCTRSSKILTGYQCAAETIFHAKGPVALAPFLLGLAYNCLGNILRSNFSDHVSGPLWLVLLWAQAYFVPIAARSIAADLPSRMQQYFKNICSYGDHIIFSQVQCERTFEECFNYLTDSGRKRKGEEWNPFIRREFGAAWFRTFGLHLDHSSEEKDAWKAILIARDLPAYFSSRSTSIFLEPYSPNQFARQLGHLQSVPVPFYKTINQPWHSRKNVTADVLKHAENNYFARKAAMSQVHQIHWFPSSDRAFDSWWLCCWANVASNISEAKKHFILEFGNDFSRTNWKRPRMQAQKLQRAPKRRARSVCVPLEESPSPPSSSSSSSSEEEEEGGGKESKEKEKGELEESLPSSLALSLVSGEESSSEYYIPLTKLRSQMPTSDEGAAEEGGTALQQNNDPAVNVEEHRKRLKKYMDMSIESIYETNQLNSVEKTVDAIYHHSGDALETPILGDLRKQLTGLKDKIPSLLSSIKSAEAERDSLCKQNRGLLVNMVREKLALQDDESKLSELQCEEARIEAEIQMLLAKKESVLSQRASAEKSVEQRKQKMEEFKNMEAKIKKAEYTCFQRRNEMSKINATVDATLMDAKRVLFQ